MERDRSGALALCVSEILDQMLTDVEEYVLDIGELQHAH